MMQEKSNSLTDQIKNIQKLSDIDLANKISELRSFSLPGLTPLLIERWHNSQDEKLKSLLYQYFLDTKDQNELEFFMEALKNDAYADKRSALVSILWQSSLDASDQLEELLNIALVGDFMTIIEVSTVVDSFDIGFEENVILDAVYQIGEAIDEEKDEERSKLLGNLRQILNELYTI